MENKIYATCNYPTKTWDITEDGYRPGAFNVVLNIVYDNSTQVRDIEYGVKFYIEDKLVGEETYPKHRMAINTLTSGFAVEPGFDLEEGKPHKIYLWARINGLETVEKEIFIESVMPEQPYPSWRWSGTEWVPPTPKPVGIFSWNEKKRKWLSEEHLYDVGTGGSTTDPLLKGK